MPTPASTTNSTASARRHRDLGLGGDALGQPARVGIPAAGVDDGEGAAVPVGVVGDPVAGHPRNVLDDGLATAQDAVDQGGLADVGAPDDGQHGDGGDRRTDRLGVADSGACSVMSSPASRRRRARCRRPEGARAACARSAPWRAASCLQHVGAQRGAGLENVVLGPRPGLGLDAATARRTRCRPEGRPRRAGVAVLAGLAGAEEADRHHRGADDEGEVGRARP